MNTEKVAHVIAEALEELGLPFGSSYLSEQMAEVVVEALAATAGDGPEAPVGKGWWKKVPSGGPSRVG